MKKNVFNRMVRMLVIAAMLCSIPCSALAADVDGPVASVERVSPRYATIRSVAAYLDISSTGMASCKVEVSLYGPYSSYRREISMYLQNQSSGWQAVESWSDTGDVCNKGHYVYKGDSYRVKGNLRVYDSSGKLVESATVYSDTISY